MSNDSSLQMSSSVHSGKEIEATHHLDANNTAGDSISEPVPRIPQISVNSLEVSQALPSSYPKQPQNYSPAPLLKMPWPRSAISKSPPPVRLGQSRAQSVQGNPLTKPPHKS